MLAQLLRRPVWALLLLLAGCDPNPNGPSAPSPGAGGSGNGGEPSRDQPKTSPLKQVGPPIGMAVIR